MNAKDKKEMKKLWQMFTQGVILGAVGFGKLAWFILKVLFISKDKED